MLKKMLEDLVYDAKTLKGRTISRKLANGLRISLFNDGDSMILTIARGDVYPSMIEWATIATRLPFDVPKSLKPEEIMLPEDGWRALRGRVPNLALVQLKFA